MKNTNPEFEHAELIFFEKLMNFAQVFAAICLGWSNFLPLSSSDGAHSNWLFFFWTVPFFVLIYISSRWLKAVFYFLSALAGLPVLFVLYFTANFAASPSEGYFTALPSIIALVGCWFILGILTILTSKIRRTESGMQAKIKKIIRMGLLGILLGLVMYQVGWSILFKTSAKGVIDYELPPGYSADYSERYGGYINGGYINGFMHITVPSRGSGKDRPLIAIVSMPSFMSENEEKVHEQIRSDIEKWSWDCRTAHDMKFIYGQEATIRGQQVPLLFYGGTNESGAPMKQLFSGIFMGKENRKVILFITGKEAQWNQKEIDTFIESIK